MILRKIKYGKIAVVIFLTVLIWVWTDLALDEELPDKSATVVVDDSVNPRLWVSFNHAPLSDIKITLSGPHAAIAALDRKLREGEESLEFVFDVTKENMDKPDDYSLRLLPFLQKDKEIKRLGLKVKSCEPEILDVNVVELVERSLPVECFDEDGIPLKFDSIDPSKVKIFALEEMRAARVQLSPREIVQARLSAVKKKPYVVLAAGQTRDAIAVKIKLAPEEDRLSDYTITNTTYSVALSPNLVGEYTVEVTNELQVLRPIAIRATEAAKSAYEGQPYPLMTLYISDDDRKKAAEEQSRAVVYNFPLEFVRKGEIELIKNTQQPAEAKFKLIPLSSASVSSGGVE